MAVGIGVGVKVAVAVAVGVGVNVAVAVAVAVAVPVGVGVAVGVVHGGRVYLLNLFGGGGATLQKSCVKKPVGPCTPAVSDPVTPAIGP